jgi:nickel-type superoxide dismutase maturation protease
MLYIRRVVGESMLPTLKPGKLVIAVRKKPKVGDIVIAKVGDREVIKRVVSITEQGFELRGDNALHSTDSRKYGLVDSNSIIAAVVLK